MTNRPEERKRLLDSVTPDEADLPLSARTWARELPWHRGPMLELRDPNSGIDARPEQKPRFQYVVARGRLWSRCLPPAPLESWGDEVPWDDDAGGLGQWCVVSATDPLHTSGLVGQWASLLEALIIPSMPHAPQLVLVKRDLDGTGGRIHPAYAMPARDPWDCWCDVTSYRNPDWITGAVPCPVLGCEQHMVWYEAGYVPGYRVCAELDGDGFKTPTIKHRFQLDHREIPGLPNRSNTMVLVLEDPERSKT